MLNRIPFRGGLFVLTISGLLAPGATPSAPAEADDVFVEEADARDDDRARTVTRPRMHPRPERGWPYTRGPRYGNVSPERFGRPGVLETSVGAFDLTQSDLGLPAPLTAGPALDVLPHQYFVLMFDARVLGEASRLHLERRLEAAGGAVIEQLAPAGFLVRLTTESFDVARRLPRVLAFVPYQPGFKLSPLIGRAPLTDPDAATADAYDLDVLLFPGEDATEVAQVVETLGGSAVVIASDTLRVELHRDALTALAHIEAVRIVFEHRKAYPLAEDTTTTIQVGANLAGVVPYHAVGIDGGGGGVDGSNSGGILAEPQVLMVLDTGIQLDSADLADLAVDAGSPGPIHRKVLAYRVTNEFGGQGDLRGCDSVIGGYSHGHLVSATALGSPGELGFGPFLSRSMDGVAPGAKLLAYDAQVAAVGGFCDDPQLDILLPGDLYDPGCAFNCGSLDQAYENYGARTFNFSWGTPADVYNSNAIDVDRFLDDHHEAMLFVAAGNGGSDYVAPIGVPDPFTLSAPGTAKNAITVGATYGTNTVSLPDQNDRWQFSSVGPAVGTTVNRTSPLLMAPGVDLDTGNVREAAGCATSDGDQLNPVECRLAQGQSGTSFSTAAASGAGLLVRDYFRQGYYPDGTTDDANNALDQIPEVSGALVKAALVVSAEYMSGENLTARRRWNNEQGYGRIQLDNVLSIQAWPASPDGMIVHDPVSFTSDLSLPFSLSALTSAQATFEICNDDQELRVALAWTDPWNTSGTLRNDLNLTLISPSGIEYRGNYFTDDSNLDGTIDIPEDCGGIGAADAETADGAINEGPWSQPVCGNTGMEGRALLIRPFDNANPTEAIYLSPDPDGDGVALEGTCTLTSNFNLNGPCDNNLDCRDPDPGNMGDGECDNPGAYRQTERGTWTVRVDAEPTVIGSQNFALIVTGGVCLGSTARFDQTSYSCSESAVITVTEFDDFGPFPDDPNIYDVEARTTVEVIDGNPGSTTFGQVVDTEDQVSFTQPVISLREFVSEPLRVSGSSSRDSNNGILDVRDGDTIRVTYLDKDPDTGLINVERSSVAFIACRLDIGFDTVLLSQFGPDASVRIQGGCERDARGKFTFGYPDRYMDADEAVVFEVFFTNEEPVDLENVIAALDCVVVDADSPLSCRFDGTGCDPTECGGDCDPMRLNNAACSSLLSVADSPKLIGRIPAGAPASAAFAIQMADEATFAGQTPTVEMLLFVTSNTSGKSDSGVGISRQRLNVDEVTTLYSTDFPMGGTELVDLNNDELIEDPIETVGGFDSLDYRFETRVYGDLTSGLDESGSPVSVNQSWTGPWDFDGSDGGFTHGLAASTDRVAADVFQINNWGEDTNFNNIEDGICADDFTTVCYRFPTDFRCPGPTFVCDSLEDFDSSAPGFTRNWNTKGGCGWQTKPDFQCSLDATRGCMVDDDCEGTCVSTANPLVSTFDPCGAVSGLCPDTHECHPGSEKPFGPCSVNSDCDLSGDGGPFDICLTVSQGCEDDAGTCSTTPISTGGVWHTGEIGSAGGSCDGSPGSPCADYEVISSSNGRLLWWELLLTPVLEKVDQSVGADGLPNARAQIDDWAWNMALDIPDGHALLTWEFDNAVEDPVRGSDLFGDQVVMGFVGGPRGAVSEGDTLASGGYPMFAPVGQCSGGGTPCVKNADCPPPQTCNATGGQVENNGVVGLNRVGDNACFFEGAMSPEALNELSLAGPLDDDQDNDTDTFFDSFVTEQGPIRNSDIRMAGGPDMRYVTLEDVIGQTGNTFQGALGFAVFEGTPFSQAQPGFGVAVDDMVVRWREITLQPDSTSCSGFSCAVLSLGNIRVYEPNAVVTITAVEPVPQAQNDCDLDGVDDGVTDCNLNAIPDIVVLALSDVEPQGEIVYLDELFPSSGVYAGQIPISSQTDLVGTLYVQPSPRGSAEFRVRYEDKDIDPGPGVERCPNDTTTDGFVEAVASVSLEPGRLTIAGYQLTDNGDDDGYADTDETVEMTIDVVNDTGQELTNVRAYLNVADPAVDCVRQGAVELGDIQAGQLVSALDPFIFKISNTQRLTVSEELTATFSVAFSADQIDAVLAPQEIVLDLDLDVDDLGQTPTMWIEDFEGAGFGKFEADDLDSGLDDLVNADGFRCQYSDPDYHLSDVFAKPAADTCYPGAPSEPTSVFHWQIDGATAGSSDGGRAFTASNSLYFGVFLTDGFTTPQGVVEAVKTTSPVNLGVNAPMLSFWQQISLVDDRFYPGFVIQPGETLDRGVVQIQVADASGFPVGPWINLEPHQNAYDALATSGVDVCMFDPYDDDTTEDDFDDPLDPLARFGPSSTCYDEFVFAYQGDTDGVFNPADIGNASVPPGPGDAPNLGVGTWVETIFDLSRFRGQRVRFRFLASTARLGHANHEEAFANNPDARDDGWWIDSVLVDETLTSPAVLTVDGKVLQHCAEDPSVGCFDVTDCINAGVLGPCEGDAPGCGNVCNVVSAFLEVDPPEISGPGQTITLSAEASTADVCLSGALQYQFIKNGSIVIRGWSTDPTHVDAPSFDTDYQVDVRCSTDTFCSGSFVAGVIVGNPNTPRVVSVVPPDDLTDVPVSTNVTVVFSEAVHPSTVNGTTFRLLDASLNQVPAGIALSQDSLRATLDPISALAANTVYTVSVVGIETLVAGTPFDPFFSAFRTDDGAPQTDLPDVSTEALLPPLALGPGALINAANGTSVSAAGDLNGDLIQDFISGAPGITIGGNTQAGAALLYLGAIDEDERAEPDIVFKGAEKYERAGVSVVGNFDFDRDGIGDFLVGAEEFNRTGTDDLPLCADDAPCGSGKAYLIYFKPEEYDIDGNGIPDYVKTCSNDNDQACNTAVECGGGGATCTANVPIELSLDEVGRTISGVIVTGGETDERVGFAVDGGGRVNLGIGQDLVIGAPGSSPGLPVRAGAGRAYLIYDAPSLSPVQCPSGHPITPFGAGDTETCTETYTLTQADIDAGVRTNTVRAGSNRTDAIRDTAVIDLTGPNLQLHKSYDDTDLDGNPWNDAPPNDNGFPDVGETIDYTFEVIGDGIVTLTGVLVVDTHVASINCPDGNPIPSIPAGETRTCTGDYALTQNDIDAGRLINLATADSNETAPVESRLSLNLDGSPQLLLDMRFVDTDADDNPWNDDGDGLAEAGETIDYELRVSNDSVVTVEQVTLEERIVALERVANAQPDQIEGVIYEGAMAGDEAGYAVAFPGDVVLGDSQEDLVIGAPFADPDLEALQTGAPVPIAPLTDAGTVYSVAGGDLGSTIIETCKIGGNDVGDPLGNQILGDQPGMFVGWDVAGAGDSIFNGEPDLLIGAPGFDVDTPALGFLSDGGLVGQVIGEMNQGIIETCKIGGGGGPNSADGVLFFGDNPGDNLGGALGGLGDVTGDGIPEVGLGASLADPDSVDQAGVAYFVDGILAESATLGGKNVGDVGDTIAGTQFVGVENGEVAGSAMAGTGDINGDGQPDFLVGAPGNDLAGISDSGTVYIVEKARPGFCGPDGCEIVDFGTGAQVRVDPLALQEDVFMFAKGIVEPTEVGEIPGPPAYPQKSMIGAANFQPGQQTFSKLTEVHIPVRQALGGQFAQNEMVDLWVRGSTGWVDYPEDGKVVDNPQLQDHLALRLEIDTLRFFVALVDDVDGDGYGDGADCAVSDDTRWDTPSAVRDVRLTHEQGVGTEIAWDLPMFPGAETIRYDVLRAISPTGFNSATCVGQNISAMQLVDTDTLNPGQIRFYLVRAENDCPSGQGSLGETSAGQPRTGVSCPTPLENRRSHLRPARGSR